MDTRLTHKEYQRFLAIKLESLFELPVQMEWRSMQQQKSLYCPTIDVALGPFVYDSSCISEEHSLLVNQYKPLITAMLECHNNNVRTLSWDTCPTTFDELGFKNTAARCLIAIEIEDSGSRKHFMGTALNAIALGRIAVVVVSKPNKLKAFVKLRRYLWFLSNALNINTDNLLILSREQLDGVFL